MEEIEYVMAVPADEYDIKLLLSQSMLPFDDISSHLPNFVIAKSEGKVIGVIGLEYCGDFSLGRSLAVAPAFRRRGIAKELYRQILVQAQLKGIKELYLLTTTAADFFTGLGFQTTIRNSTPEAVRATKEFLNGCPFTAVCMVKSLKN